MSCDVPFRLKTARAAVYWAWKELPAFGGAGGEEGGGEEGEELFVFRFSVAKKLSLVGKLRFAVWMETTKSRIGTFEHFWSEMFGVDSHVRRRRRGGRGGGGGFGSCRWNWAWKRRIRRGGL